MSAKKIKCLTEFKKLLTYHEIKNTYLFIGNGAKLQYKNMEDVKIKVTETFENLNLKNSLAIFGGDTYKKEYPDLGAVMYFIKTEFNPFLLGECFIIFDKL